MVQQTRRIVEDYVLYKLSTAYSGNVNMKQLPQQTPSQLNLALRSMAEQCEHKYGETFPDLMHKLRTANLNSSTAIDQLFSKLCQDLFQFSLKKIPMNNNTTDDKLSSLDDSQIKWGHVIALFVFAGILAVRAVECSSTEKVDDIVRWVSRFFDTKLSHWLARQGGWENLVEWSKASVNGLDPNIFNAGIFSVMGVGVLAACLGLGAMLIRK